MLFALLLLAYVQQSFTATSGKDEQVSYAKIAKAILDNSITDEELEANNFSEDEIISIIIEVGLLQGRDEETTMKLLDDMRDENQQSTSLQRSGACQQGVEKQDGTQGQTYAYNSYQDSGCDGDPDTDWTLQFAPGSAPDADDVRWWGSWYLRSVFTTAYGGNILACNLCQSPNTLLLGTNGVTLAGGISYVMSNFYIWHI